MSRVDEQKALIAKIKKEQAKLQELAKDKFALLELDPNLKYIIFIQEGNISGELIARIDTGNIDINWVFVKDIHNIKGVTKYES